MYKYFMGNQGNYISGVNTFPKVIETDEISRAEINKWLDTYLLDFDVVVERLKYVLKNEILKINFIDKDCYICFLEEKQFVFLNLLFDRVPRCILHQDDNEFVLNFTSELIIEKCYEKIGKFKLGVNYISDLKEIFFGNENTMISVKFTENQDELYLGIKENINKLKDWNNIINVLYWLYSFCSKAFVFTLTITSIKLDKFECEKVEIFNDKVLEYNIVADDVSYFIEIDGGWCARCNEILAKYDPYSRKRYIIFLPNYELNSLFASEFVLSMNEHIEILVKLLKKLNDIVERLVYLQKY